ncbi:ribonuclease H-like domain-containing protein [Tanacetum coccineum]
MNVATSNNGTNVLMLNYVTVPSTVSGPINAFTIPIAPLAFYASLAASTPAQFATSSTGPVNNAMGQVNHVAAPYVSQVTQPTGSFVMGPGLFMTLLPVHGTWIQDFMTRRVLLRCDNTGDLYPVTAPSPIPSAFLVSQQTWHQRLGYPGSEVLRSLVSNNVISCNKEKPPVLCHACQLGKHVCLPFVSSSTTVSSCFEIVHSDV